MNSVRNCVGEHPGLRHFYYYWLPPILLTAGIFIMAGDYGSVSKFTILGKILSYLLPWYSKQEIIDLSMELRKVGHFLAYAVLFVAYARAWRWHMRKSRLLAIFLALLMCLVVSLADEGWQFLHRSRTGTYRDVLLDMSGALAAAIASLPYLRQEDKGT